MHRRCDLALWKLMSRQEGNKHGFRPPLLQLELSRTTNSMLSGKGGYLRETESLKFSRQNKLEKILQD